MAATPFNFDPGSTNHRSRDPEPVALGIDIGGTAIKSIILDHSGTILRETETPSEAKSGPEPLRKKIQSVVQHHLDQGARIACVGVGCAGSVDGHRGIVRYSPNFTAGRDLNLRGWIEEDFRLPCIVENDANCAVVAEWKLGGGKGKQNVLLVTLGTGVGGGLVLNNQLFRGATGTAGEIGHFSIDYQGLPGAHGLPGTFETYCSATAIQREAAGRSARDVFTAYDTDPACKEIVDRFLVRFQVALASLANIFDPDMVLLGGAMAEGVMQHIEPIRAGVRSQVFEAIANNLQIEKAHFGNLAGSIGAALLSQQCKTDE
jgi:glucokinase